MSERKEEKEAILGAEVEEQPGLFDLLRITLPLPGVCLLPKEVRQHLRASRRERLLAFRSLLDAAINQLEEVEKPTHKVERVKVE
jgi:hypothetical protein